MASCWKCQEVLPDTARFCRRCGSKQEILVPTMPTSSMFVPYPVQTPPEAASDPYPSAVSFFPSNHKLDRLWLEEQRTAVAAKLLTLLSYVNTRRVENKELFEKNSRMDAPPLEDHSWDKVAFITGLYARFMWKYELTATQKRNIWESLLWAVLYEKTFRPKMVGGRFEELVGFFHGSAGDKELLAYMLQSMPLLLAHIDETHIRKFYRALDRLENPAALQDLRALLDQHIFIDIDETPKPVVVFPDQPALKNEWARIFLAIEHLWQFLDKKRESSNQRAFSQAKKNPSDPGTPQQLATLSGVICRNAVFRYTHTSTPSSTTLHAEQLEHAIVLAEYAIHYSTGDYVLRAEYYAVLLSGLRDLRTRLLTADVLVSDFAQRFIEDTKKFPDFSWSDLLGLLTHYLTECRLAETIDVAETESWIRIFAGLATQLPGEEKRAFVNEVRQHGVHESMALSALQEEASSPKISKVDVLAFLDSEQRTELLACIRASHLNRLRALLREMRPQLFSSLSHLLAEPQFAEILPPRRSLRIRGRNASAPDRFQDAKTLLHSANPVEQQEGLALFERAQHDTAREYLPIAREWRLYAIARVKARYQAVPLWEEDRHKGGASWEEIWNLAVFYVHVDKIWQALEVLTSGVEQRNAPFAHLRFALYCALQLLQQEARHTHEIGEVAETFLIEHLQHFPLPECYLAWSLLVSEHDSSAVSLQDTQSMMKQLTILTRFNNLLERPIHILKPEDTLSDTAIEVFEKELRHLDLNETWLFWIHDYAERNRYKLSAWQALSEGYERADESKNAEKALRHIVDTQVEMYLKHREKKNPPLVVLTHLRNHLTKLFDFYQRKGRIQDEDVLARLKHYRTTLPELWNERDNANTKLIKLTRPWLEKSGRIGVPNEAAPTPQKAWYALASELTTIQTVEDLKRLQNRLKTAIPLLAGEQKKSQEQVASVIHLIDAICALEKSAWKRDTLLHEGERINLLLQEVAGDIEQESELKSLKPLLEALRRVFKQLSESQRLFPQLEIELTPLGGGMPDDMPETALVIRIYNSGSSNVSDIHISCLEEDLVVSKREVLVSALEKGESAVVAIPVLLQVTGSPKQLDYQIHLLYQWGIHQEISSRTPLRVRLFSFHDFLRQHDLHDYELPNSYIFNRPIDFAEDDHRLFQGRENELALVRTIFFKKQMTSAPLYFHGIRRVGKTSLLNRIVLELKKEAFFPCVVDLKSVKASQYPLETVVNGLTHSILRDAQRQGLDIEGLEPVTIHHPNPLSGLERFFHELRERTGRLQLVLLLDDFYLLVAEHTTPLLDLLHRIHQSGLILFILAGWMRPELLLHAAPESRLFPLTDRPLDFLSLNAVRQVLLAPIAGYGIEIPDSTVQRVFWQTAGNPYHVARMAYEGLERLNAQHRCVLAPQDIDEIADRLASEPANFTSSLFSPLILSQEEQRTAIQFARSLNGQKNQLPLDEVSRLFDKNSIRGLEEKSILEFQRNGQEGYLRIRSHMLATFLRSRVTEPAVLPQPRSTKKRVGLFVDYENLRPLMPLNMKAREVGTMLMSYAAQFGEVVCSWACADPRNIRDLASVKLELEQVGFQVQTPSGEPQTGQSSKNLSDFVLIERIIDESTHTDPNIYIIVSGDKDYYERIATLLKGGSIVRLCASTSAGNLAEKYRKLEQARQHHQLVEGNAERDFFIDNLDAVLKLNVNKAK